MKESLRKINLLVIDEVSNNDSDEETQDYDDISRLVKLANTLNKDYKVSISVRENSERYEDLLICLSQGIDFCIMDIPKLFTIESANLFYFYKGKYFRISADFIDISIKDTKD